MLKYTKLNYIPTKPLLFLKTLNKTVAGRVSTMLQVYTSYHILKYLLYNKLMINEQANKHKIPKTEITICIYNSMCVCMYVYPRIYTCINSVLVCVHIHICMIKIKTKNIQR